MKRSYSVMDSSSTYRYFRSAFEPPKQGGVLATWWPELSHCPGVFAWIDKACINLISSDKTSFMARWRWIKALPSNASDTITTWKSEQTKKNISRRILITKYNALLSVESWTALFRTFSLHKKPLGRLSNISSPNSFAVPHKIKRAKHSPKITSITN